MVYYSIAPGKIVYEVIDQNTGDYYPVPSKRAQEALDRNRERRQKYGRITAPSYSIGSVIGGAFVFAAAGVLMYLGYFSGAAKLMSVYGY